MRAKDFRKEARESLNGKWQTALLISLIYSAIIFAISLLVNHVSVIFSLITIVITPPLTYGTAYAYYHLKSGENIGCGDFLKVGFSNFGRSWKIVWEIVKKTWWCYLIFIIPIIIAIVVIGFTIFNNSVGSIVKSTYNSGYSYTYDTYSSYLDNYDYDDYLDSYYSNYDYNDYLDSYYNNYDYDYEDNKVFDSSMEKAMKTLIGSSAVVLLVVLAFWVLFIVLSVLITIKLLLYVYSYYSAVANENITPKDAVLESERLMKGNRGRYFCLILSFFGWSLLVGLVSAIVAFSGIGIISFITTQIGTIILTPYITFATIAFYQDLKRNEEQSFNNTENYASVGNTQKIEEKDHAEQLEQEQNSQKMCTKCGSMNSKDSEFCTNCGNKL